MVYGQVYLLVSPGGPTPIWDRVIWHTVDPPIIVNCDPSCSSVSITLPPLVFTQTLDQVCEAAYDSTLSDIFL